jgi:catalase
VKNLTHEETTRIAGEDPDYMIRDMYEAIERKEFPEWDVFVHMITLLRLKTTVGISST